MTLFPGRRSLISIVPTSLLIICLVVLEALKHTHYCTTVRTMYRKTLLYWMDFSQPQGAAV